MSLRAPCLATGPASLEYRLCPFLPAVCLAMVYLPPAAPVSPPHPDVSVLSLPFRYGIVDQRVAARGRSAFADQSCRAGSEPLQDSHIVETTP